MTLVSWAKKELTRLRIHESRRLLLPQTRLGSVESLATPLVHEVVLAADLQCSNCQKRVADIISKLDDAESMEVHVLEKKVTLTRRTCSKGSSRNVAAVYNSISLKVSRMVRSSSSHR